MKVVIIGGNGMISNGMGEYLQRCGHVIHAFGRNLPTLYVPNSFVKCDLLVEELDFLSLVDSDVVIYAAGSGVQAAVHTDTNQMYSLNLNTPIKICSLLNQNNYQGTLVTLGSYMEIGCNDDEGLSFTEEDVVYSKCKVTNDYALSKCLFTRYMNDVNLSFKNFHFILPNIFSNNETGTRLLPYIIGYLNDRKNNIEIETPKFSSGGQIRQYVYMEEIMKSITLCIEKDVDSGIYNIGGGQIGSIKEIIFDLFDAYNITLNASSFGKEVRRDNDVKSLRLNCEKLYKAINYIPQTKIRDIYHG